MGPKLLWLAGALLAPAVAQVLPPLLDSRNLPPSVWACEPQGVAVQFGEHSISCGTEVPPSAYEQPPTVTWRAANVTATYSIIVVDRDSPGAGDPNGSPQALLAVSGVAGTVLQVGLALDGTVGPPMWCAGKRLSARAPAFTFHRGVADASRAETLLPSAGWTTWHQ